MTYNDYLCNPTDTIFQCCNDLGVVARDYYGCSKTSPKDNWFGIRDIKYDTKSNAYSFVLSNFVEYAAHEIHLIEKANYIKVRGYLMNPANRYLAKDEVISEVAETEIGLHSLRAAQEAAHSHLDLIWDKANLVLSKAADKMMISLLTSEAKVRGIQLPSPVNIEEKAKGESA